MQNVGMSCKAYGAQKPRQYVIVRRGCEHRTTKQIAQQVHLFNDGK